MSPFCPITPTADPVNLVIFGGTGDLAMRKIYPALSVLFQSGLLTKIYRIGILMYGKKPNLKEIIRWISFK